MQVRKETEIQEMLLNQHFLDFILSIQFFMQIYKHFYYPEYNDEKVFKIFSRMN